MEGFAVTGIDYTSMTDTELVQHARQTWDEFGASLPEQIREPIEPVFQEVVARLARTSDSVPT